MGYASIAAPLTDLLKTDAYVWNNTTEEAFQKLKQTLIQTLVLTLPDFTKTFSLEIDASTHPVGVVHHHCYNSMDRRHYLLGAKFQICTDHQSLRNLMQ